MQTFLLATALSFLAQDPFTAAPDHYHLIFENAWARATRVSYEPHGKAPVHEHPPTPTTVYVYVTDGGVMRFRHITGEHMVGVTVDRKPVEAGAIRFAHGAPETHEVEYLGEARTEYARIELRTEAVDRPVRDVRLHPAHLAGAGREIQFENGQVRIVRVRCEPSLPCPASQHPGDPAIAVHLSGARRGEIEWSPRLLTGPAELVCIELKTKPVS